ncbi:hypothetical protein CFC21_015131 [Triticum aestivum]|uniref:TF-B3 domain-containing protein n=2 Tax=Triticum aestivum TaxID=4565 RepID=A0A3B6ARE8_WHEAT|nr:uncharacterized protein LOC123184558 [Triticum aestivum]KAF6999056.1 hypothetical protein CFC21_015131 [Triticum aestivum]
MATSAACHGAGAVVKVENSIAGRVRRGHAARAAGSVGAAAEVGRLHGESSYSTFRFKVKNKQMPWMRIPGGWEEQMEGPCPRYIKLWTGNGVWSAWMNRVTNGGDSMYLTDGWVQFVKQHGVQNGDMLTFQIIGPDAWYVRIYADGGEERPIRHE